MGCGCEVRKWIEPTTAEEWCEEEGEEWQVEEWEEKEGGCG